MKNKDKKKKIIKISVIIVAVLVVISTVATILIGNNFLGYVLLLKVSVIIIVVLVVISAVATVSIGNCFVSYALSRTGSGGDREVDINLDKNAKKIIEENEQKENELAQQWSETVKNEKVEVKADDGITLRGTKYITDNQTNKWAIVLHGYHVDPSYVLPIGMHFSEQGYNVLIPSMRACADSDGKYLGMGWLDKDDLQHWINLVINQNANAEIILHGSSMGAATVLMASGDNLPQNVKAIIEDSGFTSAWDIFKSEIKARFNLPSFPVLNMCKIVAKFRAHYNIKDSVPLEFVKNSKTPILFIHGDKDDFVPEYMCEQLYEAANCVKDKLIIHNAGHIESKYKEPDTYYNKVFGFLNNI